MYTSRSPGYGLRSVTQPQQAAGIVHDLLPGCIADFARDRNLEVHPEGTRQLVEVFAVMIAPKKFNDKLENPQQDLSWLLIDENAPAFRRVHDNSYQSMCALEHARTAVTLLNILLVKDGNASPGDEKWRYVRLSELRDLWKKIFHVVPSELVERVLDQVQQRHALHYPDPDIAFTSHGVDRPGFFALRHSARWSIPEQVARELFSLL